MKQRLLVAAVGVPLLILVLVFLPPLATGLLAAAIAGAAAYELLHTAGKNIPPFVYEKQRYFSKASRLSAVQAA